MSTDCPTGVHPVAKYFDPEARKAIAKSGPLFQPRPKGTRKKGKFGARAAVKRKRLTYKGYKNVVVEDVVERNVCPLAIGLLASGYVADDTLPRKYFDPSQWEVARVLSGGIFGEEHEAIRDAAARFIECWDGGKYTPDDLATLFGDEE